MLNINTRLTSRPEELAGETTISHLQLAIELLTKSYAHSEDRSSLT